MEQIELNFEYHEKQVELLFAEKVRFKVVGKGRRFGLTRGMITYALDRCFNISGQKILWVDTTYANIQRYIQRYALPQVKNLPREIFKWNKINNEIRIRVSTDEESIIDFRSADRPENIEGFGYNLVIINEAGIVLKNENLWLETIRPMMLDYKADAIIGGTPKGKRVKGKEHLFYKLYKKCGETPTELFPDAVENNGNWKYYNYSSYDNPMLDKEEIDEYVSEISPALRDQEVYGKFIDLNSDRIIKREWFQVSSYRDFEKKPQNIKIIQSWDTAFKKNEENDYSVCTTWEITDNKYRLIDIFRERLEFPELKRKVVELNDKFNPNEVIIEDKASGISLLQELERETTIPIKAIKVDTDKITRVHSITPIIESGNVEIYTLMDVGLINAFLDECEDFPNGEFDDMVDSMSQLLAYVRIAPKTINPNPMIKKYEKRKLY